MSKFHIPTKLSVAALEALNLQHETPAVQEWYRVRPLARLSRAWNQCGKDYLSPFAMAYFANRTPLEVVEQLKEEACSTIGYCGGTRLPVVLCSGAFSTLRWLANATERQRVEYLPKPQPFSIYGYDEQRYYADLPDLQTLMEKYSTPEEVAKLSPHFTLRPEKAERCHMSQQYVERLHTAYWNQRLEPAPVPVASEPYTIKMSNVITFNV